MGSFVGHAIPGFFFILVGLWWLVHVILQYAASLKQPNRSESYSYEAHRSWKKVPSRCVRNLPLEPVVKIVAAFIGICVEMARVHWSMVDEHNEFVSPNKFAHASMYGWFCFSGIIELLNFYKLTNFSRELEYALLASAFAVEGMLFAFHLHGRDMFDVRIHTILFIIIFLTALVILLEACLPKFQREFFMARTVLCLTQGTWFWEIAFTIYGPHRWFGDAMVDLTKEQLMKDTEVITANISWHILAWCGVVLIGCMITSCLHKRGKLCACCLNSQRIVWDEDLLNGRLAAIKETTNEEEAFLDGQNDDDITKYDHDQA